METPESSGRNTQVDYVRIVIRKDKLYAVVPRNYYDILTRHVLELLGKEELTLLDLIRSCEEELRNEVKGEIGWYVMSVKFHLECKGVIVTRKYSKNGIPLLALRKRKRKGLHAYSYEL